MLVIEEEAMSIFTRSIFAKLQREMRNNTAYIVENDQNGTYFVLRRVKQYEKAEYQKDSYDVTVSEDGKIYKCSCPKFQRDGIHCCHVFNIATRKGMTKLPESFIHHRWTIEMDRKLVEMTSDIERYEDSEGNRENEISVRDAIVMSKMSSYCEQMCVDELTSKMFLEGVDKLVNAINKKRSITKGSVNDPITTNTAANDSILENNAVPDIVYRDPP